MKISRQRKRQVQRSCSSASGVSKVQQGDQGGAGVEEAKGRADEVREVTAGAQSV